ncbi:MAG: dTDP-4-dehydrorhamnose 3,5-epimerase family protein [Armatimonadota bacterium]|nr:dTDP-4-dehydrorhamnose 3,5-epimerase family protein [Armatimonadota bacterium]MDR7475291.1 dTDP-4-dehydrorhamnose 3,5-epimerase family protein [Armatimonadota bacterium]MDR7539602.1 dTDP-4-dehydrorhamnose 3,5-epimerase family protein [Armatimonadota bacterium]
MKLDIMLAKQNVATIRDVSFVPLVAHVDDRGYLIEILRQVDPHFAKFGQVYLVGNFARGTIRAFHKHEAQWDWFFISRGAAKVVLVDDRRDSPTYGQMNVFVTSAQNPSLIAIPPGVYHGWMSLADDTQLVSVASEVYNREKPDEVRISPDSFGDVWTVRGR